MLQPYTSLTVADNTGAKRIRIIQIANASAGDRIQVGDIVTATVKEASPHGQVKQHEIVKAVVVRQKYPYKRTDGSSIIFDDNAVVIVSNDRLPRGTRVIGPVARELRDKGFTKIISLAEEVL